MPQNAQRQRPDNCHEDKAGKAKENGHFFVLFAQIENEKSELANDNQRQQIHEARRRMPRRQYV